jgi:5'-phosphate synthase pdxT subunit
MKKIGVLALQGAFREHVTAIKSLGHEALEVRTVEQLDGLDGLILPGGESTAMGKLLNDFKMKAPLADKIKGGLPVWGTCAGMILLAKELDGDETCHLGVMDIKVRRNAYGRQLDSFNMSEPIEGVCEKPIPLVFIRAPFIVDAGEQVELIHEVNGDIVAARQENMLVTSFHPELTNDTSFLQYFIDKMMDTK